MLKNLFFLGIACLLFCFSSASAQAQPPISASQRIRVAVTDFEVIGNPDKRLGSSFANAFGIPLQRTGRFELYDRNAVNKLLDEAKLSATGIIENPSAFRAKNVAILVLGELEYFRVNNQDFIDATARFINVNTGETIVSAKARGANRLDFDKMADDLVAELRKVFPIEGRLLEEVKGSAGKFWFIDVGAIAGVRENTSGKLFQEVPLQSSQFFARERIGTFVVRPNAVSENITQIEVTMDAGKQPRVGGIAIFDIVSNPVVVLNPITPTDAKLLINGQVAVLINNSISLAPGAYTLRLERAGFEPLEQQVTLVAGQRLEFGRDLIAIPATLQLKLEPPDALLFLNGKPVQNGAKVPSGAYTLEIRREGYKTQSINLALENAQLFQASYRLEALPVTLTIAGADGGAELKLDGKTILERVLQLLPGTYIIAVTRAGYAPYAQTVVLEPAKPQTLNVKLEALPSTLVVRSSTPEAQLILNGQFKGNIPEGGLSIPNLAFGAYTVVVRSANYAESPPQSINLQPGQTQTLQINLQPLPARVSFSSSTPDAVLRIGAEEIRVGAMLSLPPGTYTVVVSATNHESLSQQITLTANQAREVNVDLIPNPATLRLEINAPNPQVLINGEVQAPNTSQFSLKPGTYNIVVRAATFDDAVLSITLKPGEEARQGITLKPSLAILTITSPIAGARILLNGRDLGAAPQTISVEAGNYRVALQLENHESGVETFTLSAAEKRSVQPTLRPTTGLLSLSTTPSGSSISINGQVYSSVSNLRLPEGQYTIVVSAANFDTQTIQLQIGGGEDQTRSISLTASLVFVSPNGAGNGSREQPTNLESAIRNAKFGVPIMLLDGDYTLAGTVLSGSGLNLKAANKGKVNLRNFAYQHTAGNLSLEGLRFSNSNLILELRGGNTILRDLIFENNSRAITISGNAVVQIENSQFLRHSGIAIGLEGSSQLTISTSILENTADNAIKAIGSSKLTILNSTFRDNGGTRAHIQLEGNANILMTGNTLSGGRFGLRTFDNPSGEACSSKNNFVPPLIILQNNGGSINRNC